MIFINSIPVFLLIEQAISATKNTGCLEFVFDSG